MVGCEPAWPARVPRLTALWAGLWRRYWVRRERERSESRRRLDLPTEFAKALCGVLLAFGAWLLTTGVWWPQPLLTAIPICSPAHRVPRNGVW